MARASDNFSIADEDPLSSGGLWDGGYSPSAANLKIVTNRVRAGTIDTDSIATYNGIAPGPDQFSQFTLTAYDTLVNHNSGGLVRGASPTTKTLYWGGARVRPLTNVSKIRKLISNVETDLAETSTAWAVNDVVRLEIIGTTITVFRNGTSVLSTTDSDIASGRVGIFMDFDVAESVIEVDDWSGGDFGLISLLGAGT